MRHKEMIPSTKNILFGKPVIDMGGRNELGKLMKTRSSSEDISASIMFNKSLILTYRQDIPYTLNNARAAILIITKNSTTSLTRPK